MQRLIKYGIRVPGSLQHISVRDGPVKGFEDQDDDDDDGASDGDDDDDDDDV